jgi:uncharacterized protein YigE (DUF2233 family)
MTWRLFRLRQKTIGICDLTQQRRASPEYDVVVQGPEVWMHSKLPPVITPNSRGSRVTDKTKLQPPGNLTWTKSCDTTSMVEHLE